MGSRVAVIPLDDRAVNYEAVALLGEAAGLVVRLPPKEWLGNPWRAGRMEELGRWLEQEAGVADAVVVAVDTLGYGGLVNSRRSADEVAEVLERLEVLRRIKRARPEVAILGFSVLMRVNRGDDAEEEKAYWAEHGPGLFRLSVLEDRRTMAVAGVEELAELEQVAAGIPVEIVADYRAGRARNHAVNRAMIDWAEEGIFDYLVIPQDDTVAYGWNIAEARRLRQDVQVRGLAGRVAVYPGADETAMLLLARVAAEHAGLRPRVWVRYNGSGAGEVVTAYEDRPMTEMVKAHLGPLGGWLAAEPGEADLLLFINAPGEVQGNGPDQYVLGLSEAEVAALAPVAAEAVREVRSWAGVAETLREMHTVRRDLPEFVRALGAALESGKPCAVVDVAFVNAADAVLGELLVRDGRVSELAGYGGWNTAGNTLGCVLAQAVIRCVQLRRGADAEALAAHVRFLFWRLLEDWAHMARVRSQIMVEELPRLGLAPTLGSVGEQYPAVRALVEARLGAAAAELAARCFVGRSVSAGESAITIGGVEVTEVVLPWGRLFDLTLNVTVNAWPSTDGLRRTE